MRHLSDDIVMGKFPRLCHAIINTSLSLPVPPSPLPSQSSQYILTSIICQGGYSTQAAKKHEMSQLKLLMDLRKL